MINEYFYGEIFFIESVCVIHNMDICDVLVESFNVRYMRDDGDDELYVDIPNIGLYMCIDKCLWEQLLCLHNNDYLDTLIKLVSRELTRKPVEVIIRKDVNINFSSACNCVIYVDECAVLHNYISCVYASSCSIGYASFSYLDYEILYDDSIDDILVNDVKVYLPGCIKLGNRFAGALYMYGIAFHDVGEYIRTYGILCFMSSSMIIVNKNHYLYDDLMSWLSKKDADVHLTNVMAYIFVDNSLGLFRKVNVHEDTRLIKNANK